jgi:hypothetical protein
MLESGLRRMEFDMDAAMKAFDLTDRVAIITGGNGGAGLGPLARRCTARPFLATIPAEGRVLTLFCRADPVGACPQSGRSTN